jgi:hypothetical protein
MMMLLCCCHAAGAFLKGFLNSQLNAGAWPMRFAISDAFIGANARMEINCIANLYLIMTQSEYKGIRMAQMNQLRTQSNA